MRHAGWMHWKGGRTDLTGTQMIAARDLVGVLRRRLQQGGVAVGVDRQVLDDGTAIEAKWLGKQPIVRVIPPKLALEPVVPKPSVEVGDFVAWARNAANVDGVDADHPQQILRVRKGGGDAWKTYFYETSAWYTGFAGPKSLYGGTFADGVKHAGNVDWVGRKGQRINWYGPSTRYWCDPHIKPRLQYGKFVFALGQVMLDIEDYITESSPDLPFADRWVMGAALRGNRLLTVQAELPDALTDDSTPALNTSDISTPWPVGPVNMTLCSYLLNQEDAVTLRVVNGSREVLWSGALDNPYNPWFFNTSGSEAVSLGLPENVLVRRRFGAITTDPHTMDAPLPSTESNKYTLTRNNVDLYELATSVLSLPPDGASVVACDYVGNSQVEMTVSREAKDDLASRFVFDLDGFAVPSRDVVFEAIPDPVDGIGVRATWRGFQASLIYADLRTKTLVVYRYEQYLVNAAPSYNNYAERVQVFRDGHEIAQPLLVESSLDPRDTGLARQLGVVPVGPHYDALYADATLSPMFALYGHISQFQMEPRWDWSGAHGIYSFRAYPKESWFGAARINTVSLSGAARLDASSDAHLESNRVDFDEHYSAVGCATLGNATMLSCYGYDLAGTSLAFVDGSDMATLTGVAGSQPRYHPIWLIGKPPRDGAGGFN